MERRLSCDLHGNCWGIVVSRNVGLASVNQGICILLSGVFGTMNGSSVSIENVVLLALTRVGSRRVIQISAGFMIFFSILGVRCKILELLVRFWICKITWQRKISWRSSFCLIRYSLSCFFASVRITQSLVP